MDLGNILYFFRYRISASEILNIILNIEYRAQKYPYRHKYFEYIRIYFKYPYLVLENCEEGTHTLLTARNTFRMRLALQPHPAEVLDAL